MTARAHQALELWVKCQVWADPSQNLAVSSLQPLPRITVIQFSKRCVFVRETAHVLCHTALDSLKSTESSTSAAFHLALYIPENAKAAEN